MAGLIGGPVVVAAELSLVKLKEEDPVPVSAPRKHQISRPDETSRHDGEIEPKQAWPEPAATTVEIPETGTAKAKVGTLPLRLSATTDRRAQIRVLDREETEALSVTGVVLAVRPVEGAAGPLDLALDYSGFQHLYGGDWASRLTLRQLPGCALTSPEEKNCRSLPLGSDNNAESTTLSASVSLPAASGKATSTAAAQSTVLLAATAAPSGSAGSFKATSLSPSASWSAGGSAGAFTWSYDIETPDVPGIAPELSLGYSSQAVDGRTAATNNQANWIGDGWSMEPGFIERRYISCADDAKDGNGTAKSADLCWKKDNAVLTLGGRTSVLIRDDRTGEWRQENDDGTKIERLTDTSLANGDNNGEYWVVTTPDGIRYHFGLNRLPGWSTGKPETDSTWTVPVFGNHEGEECHKDAYKDSWCRQAWRWNLDYVVDPHSDAMAYYWNKESNFYGRDVNPDTGASTATEYDRGGYLGRVEYGLRAGAAYSRKAAAKVDFTVAERCLTDCGTFDKDHAKNWPDVPFDQYCKSGDACKDRYSPSFWSRKRLTAIDTSVLTGGAYQPVDTWKLTQEFPSPGDGTDPALWLSSVTRTGHTGTGDVTLPAVTFKGQQLANRVEGATTGGKPDPVPPLVRYRVYGIETETGGTIGITYSPRDCKAGDVPSLASNTRRCYPVMWSPPDSPGAEYEPYLDWFHTYFVTQVLEADNTGGAPVKQTDYAYLDGTAWGKEEDEFTKSKHLTYGDRKGVGRVQVRTGSPAEGKQMLTEYHYFRGIDGAQVKDQEGVAVTDHSTFAGMTRSVATYNGDGGRLESTTSTTPWHGNATATQARTGLTALKAYATNAGKDEQTRTAVGDGWRTTRIVRTLDDHGLTLTESDLGDTAKSGDEKCATISYARNEGANILNLRKEVRVTAVACDTAPKLPADLISVERRYYDGATGLDTAPTKGDVTRLDEQDDQGTGYWTTARHTYDQHGRELSETDAAGVTTTTAYTPATVEAVTATTETNGLGPTITQYDPARGVVTAVTDVNSKRTEATYDGLGRTRQVWNPGWKKTDHATQPSTEYAYTISKTAANVVSTKSLQYDGSYATTYQIYDGLLRERETQAPAVGTANRVITETLYDSRGLAWKSYAAYYADGAPSGTLEKAADNKVPAMTENVYDGQGRVTDAIARKFGDEQYRAKTLYDGDRTTVIPPKGGTATTAVTDARGRVTERLQYTDASRTTSLKTRYTYGKWSEPLAVTDPADNVWTYTFDARGRQTDADDPDKGKSHTTYDRLGRTTSVTDALNTTLTTEYDDLSRKTALKKGTTVLAKWTYDTVAKGQPASAVRYIGGKEYTSTVDTYDDAYRPLSETVTIPTEAGALAGTYTWTYGYNTYTGLQEWIRHPAIGNLPAERQTTVYGEGNLPQKTTAGAVTLVNATSRDVFGRAVRTEFGTLGKKVYESLRYDEFTGRLTGSTTDRDLAPQRIDDVTYSYDDAGTVTGITTASGQDAARTVDAQCFTNDPLGRLTQAWTAKTDCAAEPSATTVGGPDPYWQSFSYDAVGNRKEQTDHTTGAVTTYTNNPNALKETKTIGGPADGRTNTFAYDNAGNTITRTLGTTAQKLTWDDEGHLAALTEGTATTSYAYDAEGDRLITKDADGTQTLTLPAGNELKARADGTKEGIRYYTHDGDTVAVRTGAGFSFLLSDHQGTAMAAVAMTTLAVTRRRQLPFGAPRTTQTSVIPGTRGFVGGTTDPTGLTHLGAREYDPTLGRFLSVDPVIDFDTPAQMNPYSYAHNNPLTQSDPTGLCPADLCGIGYPIGGTGTSKNNPVRYVQTGPVDPGGPNRATCYRGRCSDGKPLGHRNGNISNKTYTPQADAAAYRAAERQAQLEAQAEARRKAQEAERRKKDGIFGSIKKGFSDRWNTFKNDVTSADWWKHKGVDIAVSSLAVMGTTACIASVVCGGGLFIVGASALFVTGVGAHMALDTPEGRREGGAKYLKRTAIKEGQGIILGATFGRGLVGAFLNGPKQGIAGPGLSTRQGSDPLFAGIGKRDFGGMKNKLLSHLKSLW